jgi:phosphotransferase system  glucose/maltose/N-acetylglucosamine-specific IIC component
LWYFGIAFSIFFIRNGARLGAITAGAIGWITLSFWMLDLIYTALGNPLIASSSSIDVIIRNSIGVFIAGLVVASSHNVFHKIRVYGL